ncbi:unnamed protein product, partial [Dicrocoelium dendriticum]
MLPFIFSYYPRQQDALEFLVCLLDTLHSELKQGAADCYRASPPGSTVDSTSLETGNEESGLTFLQSDMGNAAKNKLPTREKIKNLFRPSRRRMIEHMAEEAPRETSPQVGRPPEPPEQKPPDTGKNQHPADISWEEENRRECSWVK